MISRGDAAKIAILLLAVKQHMIETRAVDGHDVETLRRTISDLCCVSDQNVVTCALAAALVDELTLVDRARPGLPLR